MPKIHPTATVDADARLADDTEVGPGCVIEPGVVIGPGCRLREHVVVRRGTTLGSGNIVDAFCVFGGEPQDLKFDPADETYLIIGDDNVFREGVTISRATTPGNATRIGSRTYWMVGSHAGHDATVHDECILINGSAVGGHATVGRAAILSGNVLIHQYTWIGERVMTQGISGYSAHLPPFTMGTAINGVVGLNTVGLRRAPDVTAEDRKQVKEAYRLLYRSGLSLEAALAEMDAREDWGAPAGRFREFIRAVVTAEPPYKRPLANPRRRS